MRIGYCCKFIPTPSMTQGLDKQQIKKLIEDYNQKSTTIRYLNTLSRDQAFEKIRSLIGHNFFSLQNQIEWVAKQPEQMRLLRIGSEFVSAATHPDFMWIYKHSDIQALLENNFSRIGNLARTHNIRLAFHPGQFTILNSITQDVIDRAIQEFEYHTDMARWMGYGSSFHDYGFVINIHAGGKQGGLEKLVKTINNCLSPEARNLITIENDEFSWGLDELLSIKDHVALVLDIHHHFVRTGEYIQPDDPRIQNVIESWRGIRPLGHLSTSPESQLFDHDINQLPNLEKLIEQGHKKTKLRAHSDMCWNKAVNDWAIQHLDWMDIEVEAKSKNLASKQLYDHLMEKKFDKISSSS